MAFNFKSFLVFISTLGLLSIIIFFIMMKKDSPRDSFSRKTYTAAVVEYQCVPIEHDNPVDYMLANAEEYVSLIQVARMSDTDIIIFPEYGLTDVSPFRPQWPSDSFAVEVPTPVESTNHCEQVFTSDQKVLSILAAAAKENSMYVVVNLVEKVDCTGSVDCPSQNYLTYNTNIAFDRNGCIIARYRKFNLFGEKSMSTEKEANVCTFKTDFNVVFGMFICFDIMFGDPTLRLISEKGVTDAIFSTAWFSELPFLSATAVQTGWAHSMDVNFLASGYKNPISASGGSGVYQGKKGAKTVTMPKTGGTEILVAELPIRQRPSVHLEPSPFISYSSVKNTKYVPKNPPGSDPETKEDVINQELLRRKLFLKSGFYGDLTFKQDLSLAKMSSRLLEPDHVDYRKNVLSLFSDMRPGYEASIKVSWRINAPYDDLSPRYRLFSYSGTRVFGEREGHISVCGIVACENREIDSCGKVPNLNSTVKTSIESVEIQMESSIFTMGYLPITLDFNLNQLPATSFNFSKKCDVDADKSECSIKMNLTESIDNLFTFAVYKIPS